jgi:hypothetical protein
MQPEGRFGGLPVVASARSLPFLRNRSRLQRVTESGRLIRSCGSGCLTTEPATSAYGPRLTPEPDFGTERAGQ